MNMRIDLFRSHRKSILSTALVLISSIGAVIGYMQVSEAAFLSLVILYCCLAIFLSIEFRLPLSGSAFIGALLFAIFANPEYIQADVFSIGSVGIRATDVLLFASLTFVLIERMKFHSICIPTSITSRILYLLIVWHLIAIMVGVYNGISLKDALYESRALFYFYVSYFVVSNWRTRSRSITAVLVVVFGGGATLAALAFTRFLLSTEVFSIYASNLDMFRQADDFSTGYAYSFIAFFFSLALMETSRSGFKRSIIWISIAINGFAIVVSFTRGLWLGVVVGIAAHALIILRKKGVLIKLRYLVLLIVAMTFIIGVFSLAGGDSGLTLLQARLSLSKEELVSQPRIAESLELLDRIRQRPLMGYGLGSTFIYSHPWVGPVETTYTHNAYLFFWFKMGTIGLFLFLALLASYLNSLLLAVRKPEKHLGYPNWLNGALLTTSIGLFLTAFTSPFILTLNYTLFLGFAFGLINLHRINPEPIGIGVQ